MAKVRLISSYGYREPGQARKYYGPGLVEVPDGLLRSLGLTPAAELGEPKVEAAAVEVISASSDIPLPKEFPGRSCLLQAGYGTVAAVCKLNFDELVMVKGVGPKLARQIIQAIGEVE